MIRGLGLQLLVLLALASGVALARRVQRARRRAAACDPERVPCARCGYDLRGLDLPRCPECGVVRGFDATPEELRLSEDELRRSAGHRGRGDRERGRDVAGGEQ